MVKDIVAVIPALDPDERLVSYVRDLRASGFESIIVVDDGSKDSCRNVFDSLESAATVLRHENNMGKGAALKTGFTWIKDKMPAATGVITLDSDGQHTIKDCVDLASRLRNEDMILLGERDMGLPDIPFKSRSGNIITSITFKLLYGKYLPDTQTGLRAFPIRLIDFMTEIKGRRYEYEMNVLIECTKANIPLITIPIETVYENNNEGSHFRPVADSFMVYKLLLGSFIKFTGSGIISMIVDQGLFNLLNLAAFSNGVAKKAIYILLATAIARVLSAGLNFTLNRKIVFGSNNKIGEAILKYALTCICIMILSAAGTWVISSLGANTTIAKIIVDGTLFLFSYKAQEKWVFSTTEQHDGENIKFRKKEQ